MRALLLALSLAAGCGSGGPAVPAATPEGPNLVVVTLDTVRADRLGCYGYFRDLTPNLDALAEESLVFEACHAPVAQTLPTHTTLFTGLYPREHGISANLSQTRGVYVPSPTIRTAAEVLADGGYHTAAFVSAEPVKAGTGLERGFRVWSQPEGPDVAGAETVDRALEWLARRPPGRFFLWLHVFDAHAPYEPAAPYDTYPADDADLQAYLAERGFPDRAVGSLNSAYDGEIAYVDAQVGRLLDALRSSGEWERTALVVTSDHGESVGQHGKAGHGDIWGEQLHVPLLVRWPGGPRGREATPLTSRDVLPTLLGRLPGVPAGALVAQSTGNDVLAPGYAPRPLYAQLPTSRRTMLESITEDGWRLVLGDPRGPQLFRLAGDPHELENVAAEFPERVAELRERLRELVRAQRLVRLEHGAGEIVEPDAERVRNLEALGYVEESED